VTQIDHRTLKIEYFICSTPPASFLFWITLLEVRRYFAQNKSHSDFGIGYSAILNEISSISV